MKEQRVIQVFVGSPGDVAEERRRAFEVIERVNIDKLLPEGWRFEGVGWDQTHYPKLAWLSPQEAINAGIPQPSQCDIAVFIFWKRIGTPLPLGSFIQNGAGPAPTGSTWEFHSAMEADPRPWVLVYRYQRTPEMDEKDLADPMEFARQLKAVQDFFAGFKDAQGRFTADHHGYADVNELAGRLEQDLKEFIKRQTTAGNPPNDKRTPEALPSERVPAAYLSDLKKKVASIELLGLDLKESITNGLPQVYVPAVTTPAEPAKEGEHPFRERRELILHRLGDSSLYLPGDPGSGKSTFCRWVAYVVANGAVPVHEIAPPGALAEQLPDSLRARLPVLIRLRDFWGHMGCAPDQGDWLQSDLERSILCWLAKKPYAALTPEVLERNLSKGNLLLLLDGVDEVPEEQRTNGKCAYPRHALLTALADALPAWQDRGHRILITSRPYGLRPAQRASLQLPDVTLLPLDDELQQLFIERWYAATDHANWQSLAQGLAEELRNRPDIAELPRNPLLLTALCVKFKEGKRLPEDIYHLYDSVVNQVLFNRFRGSNAERTRVRWRLEAVALGMHYGLDDANRRPAPLPSVDLDELDRILARYAERNPSTEGGSDEVLQRREELLERSGLLLPRGEGKAEFYHQDFRDYLAAERWAREERTLQNALTQFGASRDWRRMLRFLYAKMIESSGGIDRPLDALACLKNKLSKASLASGVPAALLLADCLEIAAGKARERGLDQVWAATLQQVCADSLEVVSLAADRNELFLALGRLGWDHRLGLGLDAEGLPDIAWLPVPPEAEAEFYIARYPVTQLQFQAFVAADEGYDNPHWWQGFEAGKPHLSEPRWPEPNVPRTDVDWFEAIAFCRWLTHRGKAARSGWEIQLPTEAQWLLGYVGAGNREYPWDGEPDPQRHANFDDTGLGRTSAVGVFPGGRAHCGALDMGGNVWEWCLDKYDQPSHTAIDASDDRRVLRGGSWFDVPGYLRSAFRSGSYPDDRDPNLGFRVVCRPPSSTNH